MRSAVWQHVDLAARKFTPFIFSLALVVLNLVPLQLPGYAAISPNFALMVVYYWALHRPSLLPSGAVFLVGLLQDFLSGGLIGQNAAILVVVYIIAVSQARFFYGKSAWQLHRSGIWLPDLTTFSSQCPQFGDSRTRLSAPRCEVLLHL